MSIWDTASTLPGLWPALIRGVPIEVLGADQDVGRRTIQMWFPGVDAAAWDDQGALDGAMRLTALVVGDDYVARAEAVRVAVQAPGAMTLLHPWLGYRTVIAAGPARISYAAGELRVARIELVLAPAADVVSAISSTLSGLIGAVDGLVAGAIGLVAGVGGMVLTVSAWAQGMAAAGAAAGAVADGCAALGVDAGAAAVTAATTAAAGGAAATAVASALTALPAALSSAVLVPPSPVAVAAGSVAASAPDARVALAALMTMATAIRAGTATGQMAAAVRWSAGAAVLSAAARIASAVTWESRTDAAGWRDRIVAMLDDLVADAAAIAAGGLSEAIAAWRAAEVLRAAVIADMHEVIGRLPPVVSYDPPRPVSVWLIAQHVAGDDPSAVADAVADIVRRNRLPHPARAGADGAIEIEAAI